MEVSKAINVLPALLCMYLVTPTQLDAINDYELVAKGQCEYMTNWTCYVLPSLIPPVFTCAFNASAGAPRYRSYDTVLRYKVTISE